MFLAAFTSLSCTVPHAAHAHSRTLSGFGPSFTPQAEHTWLVGSNRPIRANVRPYDPGSPCEILVDFNTSDHVEKYRYRAGVEITGSRQISSQADDWWTAWRQFFF